MTEIQEGIQKIMDAYNLSEEQATNILQPGLVGSRVIGLLASKRNFDPVKEMKYIEKSRTSKCRCKHWTQTNPCFFHTCRHSPENHYGLVFSRVQDGMKINETWKNGLTKITNLNTNEVTYE